MATHHASPGDVVDPATWDEDLPATHSKAIAETDGLELVRPVLEPGEDMRRGGHCHVRGPAVIHCLEGAIEVDALGSCGRLGPGRLLYLDGGTGHAIRGIERSTVLLTIVLA